MRISDWSSDVCSSDLLLDWHVSREVDNLSRQNAEAFQEAVGEGKPTGEIFDKAVESAPDAKLREQYELSIRAVAAFERFKAVCDARLGVAGPSRSEEHTTELQSLMRITYAGFCLKNKRKNSHRTYRQRRPQ